MLRKSVHIIINPISGVRKKKLLDKFLDQNLDQQRFDHHIIYTRKPGHATEIARESARQGIDIVVAAGGDGSVNEVVKGVFQTDTLMGIIPLGSGNGLAHHLNIPTNPVTAIQLINQLKIKKIDTVSINDDIFVSLAGVGFDAQVARKFEKAKRRGFLAYFTIVSKEYPSYKPTGYQLWVDGKKLYREALFISFANSNQFGYNTLIAPQAQVDDGWIDVCIVKKVPVIELPLIAHLLYWKQIDKSKYVEILRAKDIQVYRQKGKLVNIDGEAVKMGKRLHIRVNPRSLNLIVP